MAITDLTGTKWLFKNASDIDFSSYSARVNIDFISNNQSFTEMNIGSLIFEPAFSYTIEYNNTSSLSNIVCYSSSDWSNNAYRIISITGGTDATNSTLIQWLQANGTLTPAPVGYEVTFVTNGGTSVTKLENVEELPTPLPTTTKTNNIFVGWFYDSGFEEKAFSGDVISSNITLYAKWYANMEDFYEDVADEIRSKNGETNPIKHTDFAYKIKNIQGAKELTQAQYDALATKDANTYYLITG